MQRMKSCWQNVWCWHTSSEIPKLPYRRRCLWLDFVLKVYPIRPNPVLLSPPPALRPWWLTTTGIKVKRWWHLLCEHTPSFCQTAAPFSWTCTAEETLSLPWMLQSLLRGSPTSTKFKCHQKSYCIWPELLFVEKSSCHHLLTECDHISWVIQAPVLVCPEFSCAATSCLHLIHQESTAMLQRQTQEQECEPSFPNQKHLP